MLTLSLSKPTLGDRASKGASSGGKDVCRRGWAELVDVMDMVEGLRRLMDGGGAESPAARFLLELEPFARVLMAGSGDGEGYGGECAGGEVWLWYGGELIVAEMKNDLDEPEVCDVEVVKLWYLQSEWKKVFGDGAGSCWSGAFESSTGRRFTVWWSQPCMGPGRTCYRTPLLVRCRWAAHVVQASHRVIR